LFDTAGCRAARIFLGFLPEFDPEISGKIPAFWRLPSSLAEGRAKTRTLGTDKPWCDTGAVQGFWGFGVGNGVRSEEVGLMSSRQEMG
jgi:hypothetical protein